MKTIWLIGAAVVVVMTGESMADSRTYEFRDFDRIDISTGLHAIVAKGSDWRVELEAPDAESLYEVEINVSNGVLKAHRRQGSFLEFMFKGGLLGLMFRESSQAKLRITMPALIGIEAGSGAAVEADELSGDDPSIGVSSGATVDVRTTNGASLGLDASSGGAITLSGHCGRAEMAFSSGGQVSARDLSCTSAAIDGSSGGSAALTVTGEVSGSLSSGASLLLTAKPQSIDVKSTSGGSVRVQ